MKWEKSILSDKKLGVEEKKVFYQRVLLPCNILYWERNGFGVLLNELNSSEHDTFYVLKLKVISKNATKIKWN